LQELHCICIPCSLAQMNALPHAQSIGRNPPVSTIAALSSRHDTIICDKLDHASIVDGCRLSGAECVRYRHNDRDHLARCLRIAGPLRRAMVVVDAVFSMDGDVVKLDEVVELCRQYRAALIVDEAHSLGVLGPTGRGVQDHFRVVAHDIDLVKTGTLSKTIPSIGGYAAGTRKMCQILSHGARGFIYSASLAPPATAAALAALEVMEAEPERVRRVQANALYFTDRLSEIGVAADPLTPIFPIACRDEVHALQLARYCQRRGIFVQAIIPPVVPANGARLRAAVSAAHSTDEISYVAGILRDGLHAPSI